MKKRHLKKHTARSSVLPEWAYEKPLFKFTKEGISLVYKEPKRDKFGEIIRSK